MLRLFEKINSAIKEPFVGNYIFSEDELSEIYDYTNKLLRKYDANRGNILPEHYDAILFIAMVNAVRSWNSGENTFFECIYKKLIGTASASAKIYKRLTEAIENLGCSNQIMYLSGCTKRYYATILAHAFAPINSTTSFLDLCWDLYTKDMNLTYTKNDEIFILVAEELKRKFSNEESLDEDFKLGSKVYSLRAGIKRMAIDAPRQMINLIDDTVSLLDRLFSSAVLEKHNFYNQFVCDWWYEKEKTFGLDAPKRRNYERAVTDYSILRPKYSFINNRVVLLIPSIRLKNNFYDNPILSIYQNGELVFQEDMLTFGSGLTMATKEKMISVDSLISETGTLNFILTIEHCGEVIYNSKKTLNREFLLFKDQREIIQEECIPGNYILYTPNIDGLSSFPENIKKQDDNLFVLIAEDGDSIQNINRAIFFMNEKNNRDIRIIIDKKNNAKFINGNSEYQVIDGDVIIEVKNEIDVSKYGIRYETTDIKLSEFTYEAYEDIKQYNITELLNVCEPQKINIFSYIDNKIISSLNIIKFNNIQIIFDKSLYFDTDNIGNVRFLTEKYDKTVSFDISQGNVIIPFEDGDIVIAPPLLRWTIDNSNTRLKYVDDIWYKSLTNSSELIIDMPIDISYEVLLSNSQVLTESTSLNKFKLGETIYSLPKSIKEITAFIKAEKIGIIPIFKICLSEKFKDSPINIEENELVWTPKKLFIGDKNALFNITISKNEKIVYKFQARIKNQVFPLNNIEIGRYTISVNLHKSVAFKSQYTLVYQKQIIFGDINIVRFKDKYLRCNKVMMMGKADDENIRTFYIDNLKYIREDEGCLYYTGKIFVCNQEGEKKYLNTMPNSEGGYDRINPVRLELRTENSCFIVAGANPKNIYDFLGEFTLDTKNRISNFDKNVRGIDYYIFETKELIKNV